MLELIPINNYSYIFFNVNLLFILLTLVHTLRYTGFTYETQIFNRFFAILLLIFLLVFMGLRPLSWQFGDMMNYARKFDYFVRGWELEINKDVVFYSIMKFFANIDSKMFFFFTIGFCYISFTYFAMKNFFKEYYFFAFLIIISSFEFWSYGTNGIRNGLATSIILLAFSFMERKLIMYFLFVLAFSIHSSVFIPIFAYFVTYFFKDSNIFYKAWFVSILISVILGNQIGNFISATGLLSQDIVAGYFQNTDAIAYGYTKTGFRWDFLIYSFIPVIISYYFIYKKNFTDPIYTRLTNIYLVSNSIWILVIEATFSNRFAYLSWFMMGLIIIYPLLKNVFFNNQFKIIGFTILGYFSFTYLMNFILPNL